MFDSHNKGRALFKKLLLFKNFNSRAEGKADAQYSIVLAPSGVLFAARFFRSLVALWMAFAKELFGKPLMCLQGMPHLKQQKIPRSYNQMVCCVCLYTLFTIFCGARTCIALISVTQVKSQQ